MTRLTFGVTSSSFLASSVFRQVADDYQKEYTLAAGVVHSTVYVDDCLTGASSLSEAVHLRTKLNSLLFKAGMALRKWSSNSKELLSSILESLCESWIGVSLRIILRVPRQVFRGKLQLIVFVLLFFCLKTHQILPRNRLLLQWPVFMTFWVGFPQQHF